MKIFAISFAISILIHLILFFNYKIEKKDEDKSLQEDISKTEVKFVKLQPKATQQKAQEPKQEVVKKEPVKNEKKVVETTKTKEPTKTKQEPKPKELKQAKQLQNSILKEQVVEKQKTIQDKTLENFLSQKEPINKDILDELHKLYGKEYESFTQVQKAYLEKNLNHFQTITQRVLNRLGYPKLAAKLKIGGINVVEFMFHPNGDISDLKIVGSSDYTILDEYTLELIRIAYKEYPKPTEPTKLRFKVHYRIY